MVGLIHVDREEWDLDLWIWSLACDLAGTVPMWVRQTDGCPDG
jgi:hypothetical protein